MLRIVPRTAVQDIYEEYSSKWQGPLRVGSGTWSEDPPQILQKKHIKGPSILLLSQVRTLRIQCVTWAGKTRFQITNNNTAICLGILFSQCFPLFLKFNQSHNCICLTYHYASQQKLEEKQSHHEFLYRWFADKNSLSIVFIYFFFSPSLVFHDYRALAM